MLISVNFPVPSTSTPKLPPALAQISHDELVLIELQGELEVECTSDSERDGRLVGRLRIDDDGKKPTLMIPDDGDDNSQSQAAEPSTSTVSWDAIAVIKRKIVFSKRPMPIVGRQL
ncbi:hypothetical protein DFH06DRAFT_1165758 [Mycena polygramma]|nr:hypothetical protein DFH06DRAFT_1165758 [Mycena polygramma]